MRLKFWKRARYFDFSRHRNPPVVLHELISAIVGAIYGAISYVVGVLGGSTVYGIAVGGTVYGISGSMISSLLLIAASMGASMATSSVAAKSGRQSSLSTGGFLLYNREKESL